MLSVQSQQSSQPITFNQTVVILLAHQKSARENREELSLKSKIQSFLPLSNLEHIYNFPTLITVSENSYINNSAKELLPFHPHAQIVSCLNQVNTWHDVNFKAAMDKLAAQGLIKIGQQLIIAGSDQDICFLFTAIAAAIAGYKVYALIEEHSDWETPIAEVAMSRMIRVGCQIINLATLSRAIQPQTHTTNFMNLSQKRLALANLSSSTKLFPG